jgi:P27 family predicted phage terminase small subunit
MGKRGTKPKPLELRRLEGNPAKRPLNLDDAVVANGRPQPPDYVSNYAREVWDRVIGSMPSTVYTAADQDLLAAYCVASDLHRSAAMQAGREGAVIPGEGEGRSYVNPCIKVLNEAAQKMAMIGSRLGLDPAARASLKVPKDEKPISKFAGLVAFPGGLSE